MPDNLDIHQCVADLKEAFGGESATDRDIVDAAIVRLALEGHADDVASVTALSQAFAATRRRTIHTHTIRARFKIREALLDDMRSAGAEVTGSLIESNGECTSTTTKSGDLMRGNGHTIKPPAASMDTVTLYAPSLEAFPSEADFNTAMSSIEDVFQRSVLPNPIVCCILSIKHALMMGYKDRRDVAWELVQKVVAKYQISLTLREFDRHFDRRESFYATITAESNARKHSERSNSGSESISAVAHDTAQRTCEAIHAPLLVAAQQCVQRRKNGNAHVTLAQISQKCRHAGLDHHQLIMAVLNLGVSVESADVVYFLDDAVLKSRPRGVSDKQNNDTPPLSTSTPDTASDARISGEAADTTVRGRRTLESQQINMGRMPRIPRNEIIEPERTRYIRDPRPVRMAPITDCFVDRTIGSGTFLDGNLNITDGPLPQVIERKAPVTRTGDEVSVLNVLEKIGEKQPPKIIINTCLNVLRQENRELAHIEEVARRLCGLDEEAFNNVWVEVLADRRGKIKKDDEAKEVSIPISDVEAFFLNPPKNNVPLHRSQPVNEDRPLQRPKTPDIIEDEKRIFGKGDDSTEEIPSDDDDSGAAGDYEDDESEFEAFDYSVLNIDPLLPTTAKPGSEDKVLVLSARYAAGFPLWHDGDVKHHGPRNAVSDESSGMLDGHGGDVMEEIEDDE